MHNKCNVHSISEQVLVDCAEDESTSRSADDCEVAYTYYHSEGSYGYVSCVSAWDSHVGFEFTVTPDDGHVSVLISDDALTCAGAHDFEDMSYIVEHSRMIASEEEFTVSVSAADQV